MRETSSHHIILLSGGEIFTSFHVVSGEEIYTLYCLFAEETIHVILFCLLSENYTVYIIVVC